MVDDGVFVGVIGGVFDGVIDGVLDGVLVGVADIPIDFVGVDVLVGVFVG
jgi:hypothetical protein